MEDLPDYHQIVQPIFDDAYAAAPDGFRDALVAARDTIGIYLAETWRRLSPHHLGYDDVGRTLFVVDRMLTGGRFRRIIEVNLRRRSIGFATVGPQLEPPDPKSHFDLPRVFLPPAQGRCCPRRLSYRERFEMARGIR